jgi:hypothetical protein
VSPVPCIQLRQGYDETTWEPEEHVLGATEALNAWKAVKKAKKAARKAEAARRVAAEEAEEAEEEEEAEEAEEEEAAKGEVAAGDDDDDILIGSPIKDDNDAADEEEEEDGEEESFEVSSIRARRVVIGDDGSEREEYLVRWAGYTCDDDTWEPRESLEELDVFAEFEERCAREIAINAHAKPNGGASKSKPRSFIR